MQLQDKNHPPGPLPCCFAAEGGEISSLAVILSACGAQNHRFLFIPALGRGQGWVKSVLAGQIHLYAIALGLRWIINDLPPCCYILVYTTSPFGPVGDTGPKFGGLTPVTAG
jgi:hypothetical protein